MTHKLETETQRALIRIIEEFVDIDPDTVTPDTRIIRDLSIDSIDFLDICSEIDDIFDVELPVESWAAGDGFEGDNIAEFMTLRSVATYIDKMRTGNGHHGK